MASLTKITEFRRKLRDDKKIARRQKKVRKMLQKQKAASN